MRIALPHPTHPLKLRACLRLREPHRTREREVLLQALANGELAIAQGRVVTHAQAAQQLMVRFPA